jgi:hypothetical protein
MKFRDYIDLKSPDNAFLVLQYGDRISIKGTGVKGIVTGKSLQISGESGVRNCNVDVKLQGRGGGYTFKWNDILKLNNGGNSVV